LFALNVERAYIIRIVFNGAFGRIVNRAFVNCARQKTTHALARKRNLQKGTRKIYAVSCVGKKYKIDMSFPPPFGRGKHSTFILPHPKGGGNTQHSFFHLFKKLIHMHRILPMHVISTQTHAKSHCKLLFKTACQVGASYFQRRTEP
jgi:hypothetical protein